MEQIPLFLEVYKFAFQVVNLLFWNEIHVDKENLDLGRNIVIENENQVWKWKSPTPKEITPSTRYVRAGAPH